MQKVLYVAFHLLQCLLPSKRVLYKCKLFNALPNVVGKDGLSNFLNEGEATSWNEEYLGLKEYLKNLPKYTLVNSKVNNFLKIPFCEACRVSEEKIVRLNNLSAGGQIQRPFPTQHPPFSDRPFFVPKQQQASGYLP